MNKLEYYNRQKEPWDNSEVEKLKDEYEIKSMNISEIADIHRRTPGSISYKLKNLGIVSINTEARGYLEYKNSELYKEIINAPREIKTNISSNTGEIWTEEETIQLLKNLKKGKTIEEIAREHKRTVAGINSKRNALVKDYYFGNRLSIEEINKHTLLPENYIKILINKAEKRETKKNKPTIIQDEKTLKEDENNLILKEILSLLKEINSKL